MEVSTPVSLTPSMISKSHSIFNTIGLIDAKYNSSRLNDSLGQLYLRRRSQLLRDKNPINTTLRWSYAKLRFEIIKAKHSNQDCISFSSKTSVDCNSDNGSLSARQKITKKATAKGFAGVHFVFDQHKLAISHLKFANNDKSKLCCASLDGKISICDILSNPPQVLMTLEGHNQGITAIDWSISNDLIVSSSFDKTIRLWKINDDNSAVCLRVVDDKLHSQVLCCCFFPANNNFIIAGNSNGYLHVLNVSTGMYLQEGTSKIGGKILSLACEGSGGRLIWAGNDNGIITSLKLESSTGRLFRLKRISIFGNSAITSLSWRSWLTRKTLFPMLLINSTCNSLFLCKIIDPQGSLKMWKNYPIKHRQYLVRSTFYPQINSCFIASGSEDGSVHLLDPMRDGKAALVNTLHGHSAPVLALDFNYNESHLATGDQQGLVIIWRS